MPIEAHRPSAGLSPREALPGLAIAFDEEAMKGYVGAALFGSDADAYTVGSCTPTRPLYIPGEACVLRYRFEARHNATGAVVEPLVTGRVFPNRSACEAYMRRKLEPLAARMRGRPDVAALSAAAAVIEPLKMVVHVWPIDGELPTLIDAADRRRMLEVLRETLPDVVEQRLVAEDCLIELVSYRRRQRCVLRYTVGGRAAGGGATRSVVVYGKVTGVGNETLADPAIEALREHFRRRSGVRRLVLPRLLGWRPDLQLALLEALPGDATIRAAIRARLRSRPEPGPVALEGMVATCAHAAVTLHTSGVRVGPVRAFADELAGLDRDVASARRFVPRFAERADTWLERIAALGKKTEPFELRLGHGDFNHGQLLFDRSSGALLDLDTLCQAEPALDLGKFTAHIRAECEKLRRRASVSSTLGDELAEGFLDAYVGEAGTAAEDEARLRARTSLYEALALVRLTVRSQHDFEETRLEIATGLLEERLASLAAGPLLKQPRT